MNATTTERTASGACLCGTVRFVARGVPEKFAACHCEMCRRWTGSALLDLDVPVENVEWSGEEHIRTFQSSDWAERAWCDRCGSNLWFRMTQDNEWSGSYGIPLGLFDDASGFEMSTEIFIDQKPDSFAYAGTGRTVLTRAECVAKFPALDDATSQGADVT